MGLNAGERGSNVESVDRVIVKELDQAQRHRDGELRATHIAAVLDGAVGGVEAPQVAVAAQRHPAHPDAARVERELGARRPGGGGCEHDERDGDGSNSHGSPQNGEKAATI